MIGIIVAHYKEVNKIDLPLIKTEKSNQFEIKHYDLNGETLIYVLSGVGIANAASATQELISNYKVSEIWNYGAVGGNKHVNVYDIVTPEKIFYYDVVTPWYKRGQTPGEKEFYKNSISSDKNNNLASGSSFVDQKEVIVSIKKELDADIFDMEAAAIAQVCDKNNIPFKTVKCVSDSIGHTDPNDHEDILIRIENAGKYAFEEVIKRIKK